MSAQVSRARMVGLRSDVPGRIPRRGIILAPDRLGAFALIIHSAMLWQRILRICLFQLDKNPNPNKVWFTWHHSGSVLFSVCTNSMWGHLPLSNELSWTMLAAEISSSAALKSAFGVRHPQTGTMEDSLAITSLMILQVESLSPCQPAKACLSLSR